MVKRQTKNYQAPTVKVVQFTIERGFEFSGEGDNGVIRDFESIDASPRNNQYNNTANDWGTFSEM